jgi:hypothetical protein
VGAQALRWSEASHWKRSFVPPGGWRPLERRAALLCRLRDYATSFGGPNELMERPAVHGPGVPSRCSTVGWASSSSPGTPCLSSHRMHDCEAHSGCRPRDSYTSADSTTSGHRLLVSLPHDRCLARLGLGARASLSDRLPTLVVWLSSGLRSPVEIPGERRGRLEVASARRDLTCPAPRRQCGCRSLLPSWIHRVSCVMSAPAAMHPAGHRPSLASWSWNARITPARSANKSLRPSAISRSSATAAPTSTGSRLTCRAAVPGSRAAVMPSGSAFARFTTMLWTVDPACDRTTWRGLTSS